MGEEVPPERTLIRRKVLERAGINPMSARSSFPVEVHVSRSLRLAVLLLPILLLQACGSSGNAGTDVAISDSAGVTIVTSPGEDRVLGWTFTEESRIGGKDDGPESFSSVHHTGVGVDAAGVIHVLDFEENQVHRFGRDGRHLMTLGRRGSGPGEMERGVQLAVSPEGGDMVYDFPVHRLVLWNGAGDLLPAVPAGGDGFPGRISAGLTWRGDTIAYVRDVRDTLMEISEVTVVTPRDTTFLTRLGGPLPTMVDLGCVGLSIAPYFTSSLITAVGDGVVAVTTQTRYEVDLYRGRVKVGSVRRAITPRPVVEQDVAALYPDGYRILFSNGSGCVVEIAEAVKKVGVAASYPLVDRMVFGPGGELWVQRYLPKDARPMIDVFDPDGRYLGTHTGFRLPVGFIGTDRAVFPLTDEETDLVSLGIYRIDRNPPGR